MKEIGFTYSGEDVLLGSEFRSLEPFLSVDGFKTRCSHVFTHKLAGVTTWLLDHSTDYSTSKQKGRVKVRTACILRTSDLKVPYFRLLQKRRLYMRKRQEVLFPR